MVSTVFRIFVFSGNERKLVHKAGPYMSDDHGLQVLELIESLDAMVVQLMKVESRLLIELHEVVASSDLSIKCLSQREIRNRRF